MTFLQSTAECATLMPGHHRTLHSPAKSAWHQPTEAYIQLTMNSPQKRFCLNGRASKSKFLSALTTPAIGTALIVCLALSGTVWPAQSATPPILQESEKTTVGHRISNLKLTDLD